MRKYILMIPALAILLVSCSKRFTDTDIEKLFVNNEEQLLIQYNYLQTDNKQALFFEGFDNNVNNWPVNTNTNEQAAQIQSGEYKISGRGTTAMAYGILKAIDTSKNYEIEVRLKLSSLNGGFGYPKQGLFFNGSLTNGILNGNGLFVNDNIPRHSFDLLTLPANTRLTGGDQFEYTSDYYDVLTLRKIKGRYGLFINKIPVGTGSSGQLNYGGQYVGFVVYGRMNIDYLKVDYITL